MGALCGKAEEGGSPNNAGGGQTNQTTATETAVPDEVARDDDVQLVVPNNGSEGKEEDEKRVVEDATNNSAGGEAAYSFWDRNKTFKPEVKVPSKSNKLQNTIHATMRATLGGGAELYQSVKLPEGEDVNEWIAVNTIHFFNAASMIYGTCTQFCTDQSCPNMTAGKAEYLWKDNDKYKKPTRVSAPTYIDLLLTWADEKICNPQLFPVEQNAKFPRNFLSEVKQIYKRLFRLYAHLYCTHNEKIRSIGANAHLNTCFKHFIYFVLEFNLIDAPEFQPLDKLIQKLKQQMQEKQNQS